MTWWVYKCRYSARDNQTLYGDWADIFEDLGKTTEWGSTKWVPDLARLKTGDRILAYQTDRNELVGVATVSGWRNRASQRELLVKPIQGIGTKIRPLKKADRHIAAIPAFQQGPRGTLFSISAADARRVLAAARGRRSSGTTFGSEETSSNASGAGFGSSKENRLVEIAAVKHVTKQLRAQGWLVRDVSTENRGYDLECTKGGRVRHVEVKGARGAGAQFIITANEKREWENHPDFELALVTQALASPELKLFRGRKDLRRFNFKPLSYIAALCS